MSDPSVDHPRGTEPVAEPDVERDPAPEPEAEPVQREGAWEPLGSGDSPAVAGEAPRNMIPARAQRRTAFERVSMRVLATCGIVGLATALGAILVSQDVSGWIVGLVIGVVSVVLAGILWSSRQL
jgi:hypothetical protein